MCARTCIPWAVIAFAIIHGGAAANDRTDQLVLDVAYTISGERAAGLSGLDWCDNKLLTIDDRNDSEIHQIDLSEDGARLVPAMTIVIPSVTVDPPWPRRLLMFARKLLGRGIYDWEGISCSDERIWLVSEVDGAVLRLGSNDEPEWFFSGYVPRLQRDGLYSKVFTGVEALTRVDETKMLMGHERNPPAIIQIGTNEDNVVVKNLTNESETAASHAVEPDITGMDSDGKFLYTLHRNAMLVCVRALDTFRVLSCMSYQETERHSDHLYENMQYGRAEGLAINDNHIYIVLDNNSETRVSDGSHRPVVFVFVNPWHVASGIQKIN